ncbi:bifunctional riboflavin kinase/FAD synthetase [Catenovulum sp. SM1970]|uniref:bifunctional riboflavin kinase/FAD synthetase n=1 Tax=Marinifaba aquimaris TaxID=2741323 RepID=UPI001574D0AC|nr:bifunctional riboflavin kinase/FAD synthetase [Marinifaba aquimaris]NTS76701.1 bifunctional riboflavin kinase/FAD synthetase [Marinifaba aquimaris]
MELIRDLQGILPKHHGCVLTIGNFDGVHLGHQAVLAQVKAKAKALNLPAVVMVFEPQPIEFFSPDKAPARICRWRDKYELLKAQQIDRMLCVRFNEKFAALSANEFIEILLLEKLGVKHLVIGDDFRFGKARMGDFTTLQAAGEKHQFTVEDTLSYLKQGVRVSSTSVRQSLALGDFDKATALLARPFSISGHVVHGDKIGRTIGFPTLNILLRRQVSPVSGVYAVQVNHQGQVLNGVANVGTRPTVKGIRQQLEVHLFDFAGDLYGQRLTITFKKKLRDEQKFDSVDALKQQIKLDASHAKTALMCD